MDFVEIRKNDTFRCGHTIVIMEARRDQLEPCSVGTQPNDPTAAQGHRRAILARHEREPPLSHRHVENEDHGGHLDGGVVVERSAMELVARADALARD